MKKPKEERSNVSVDLSPAQKLRLRQLARESHPPLTLASYVRDFLIEHAIREGWTFSRRYVLVEP